MTNIVGRAVLELRVPGWRPHEREEMLAVLSALHGADSLIIGCGYRFSGRLMVEIAVPERGLDIAEVSKRLQLICWSALQLHRERSKQ